VAARARCGARGAAGGREGGAPSGGKQRGGAPPPGREGRERRALHERENKETEKLLVQQWWRLIGEDEVR
jgi:hypothetical protein